MIGFATVSLPKCWCWWRSVSRTAPQSQYLQDLVQLKTSIGIFDYGSIPIHTILGMNIHLPAILMFTKGTRFWHTAIWHWSLGIFLIHTHTGCWWVMTNASMWSMVPTCFSTKIHVANSSVGLGWCWCHFLFGLFTLCLPSWHCRMGHIPILSSETHMFFRVWEFLTKHTSQLHGLWRYCLLNNHKID